ncbi:helix-turn-helix domain-containing protein [Amycolatopsis sp. EV170708-02-1]|uniref:helix-turn-helix domain-containing protein n=1 Tax=Amycolatopsis sp. EV170708-02-1 TaxID=2919322 RepID=UPI001F0C5B12|nr:helix-turn-helix transcriptional regulator [Amycolatopsis sp. EV170708-02-1]UMP04138.1 helix-turn-helix domain-containing protein [Amycolatopsis sp. EV170708-02-1]
MMLQTTRAPNTFAPVKLPDIDNGRYVPLGVLIARVRLWNRWSVIATANRAGVKEQTIRKIENGERQLTRVPTIMRLADALEMPREQLFNWVVKEQEYRAARKEA